MALPTPETGKVGSKQPWELDALSTPLAKYGLFMDGLSLLTNCVCSLRFPPCTWPLLAAFGSPSFSIHTLKWGNWIWSPCFPGLNCVIEKTMGLIAFGQVPALDQLAGVKLGIIVRGQLGFRQQWGCGQGLLVWCVGIDSAGFLFRHIKVISLLAWTVFWSLASLLWVSSLWTNPSNLWISVNEQEIKWF